MSKCREVAGILFKHQCSEPAVAQCTRCRKPVCRTHHRGTGYSLLCISCAREAVKDPAQRNNMAYLQDDPYFFWYYSGSRWYNDPYGAEDYALFDSNDADFGQGAESDWYGS